MPVALPSCFIFFCLDLTATAKAAPPCATFEHTWDTKIKVSPPVATAFKPIGVSAWCIPVITMYGKAAANNPTITNPRWADKNLIASANQVPKIPPIGPTINNAKGTLIIIINVGSKINLITSGDTFLANLVMYDIIQTIKMIGITEYE